MTAIITHRRLHKLGACSEQLDAFEALFGEVVTLTSREHAIALATQHMFDFNWSWVAKRFLGDAAYADYERIAAPARADYERITAPAGADYERIRDAEWADYERIVAAAWTDYQRIHAAALTDYERIRATTFAGLYYDQEQA